MSDNCTITCGELNSPISSQSVIYKGEELSCIGAGIPDNLESLIKKIDTAICQKLQDIEIFNNFNNLGNGVEIYQGKTNLGEHKFTTLNSPDNSVSISFNEQNQEVDIEVDIPSINWGEIIGNLDNQTDLKNALDGKEDSFSKNTGFNKKFGTTAGTVAEGNDSRIDNGQTAFGWGDHSTEGYLTSYTESDPTVPNHVKNITTTEKSNWNTAYGWGDHSTEGYLTSYTESDPTVPSHVKSITSTEKSNWNTAYGWGDHSTEGYLTSESDTLQSVTDRGNTTTDSVGIGITTTPSEKLEVGGNITADKVYSTSATSSLRKLKKNILPFEGSGLDLVNSLKIQKFDYKKEEKGTGQIGIMADDSPEEFLTEEKDAVNLYKTIFVQAKAIQELSDKNKELERKLEKLLPNG